MPLLYCKKYKKRNNAKPVNYSNNTNKPINGWHQAYLNGSY